MSVIAVAGLAAGIAVAVSSAATAAATPLISGTFVGQNGAAASGQTVTATVWPTGAYIESLGDTAVVPTKTLSVAATGAGGTYSLSPTVSGLGANYTEPDGTVNLELDATDTTGDVQGYSVSAAVPNSDAAKSPYIISAGTQSARVSFNLASSTVTDAIGTAPAETVPSPTTAQATAGNAGSVSPDIGGGIPAGCGNTWAKNKFYPKRQEEFLNLYHYGTTTVDEEIGSSHTLGVGVAVTGGGWSASGSASLETHSSTGGDNDYSGSTNDQLSNYVNYEHYMMRCWRAGGTSIYYRHQTRPTSMNLLQVPALVTHIANRSWNIKYCEPYYSGHWRKSYGSNQTFSGGVSAPYISLNASASFSKDTTVTWSPPRVGEELCGSTSAGFGAAPFAGGEKLPRTVCGSPATSAAKPDSVPNC